MEEDEGGKRRAKCHSFVTCKLLSNNCPSRIIIVRSEKERMARKRSLFHVTGELLADNRRRKSPRLIVPSCELVSYTSERDGGENGASSFKGGTRRVTSRRDKVELAKLSLLACDGSIMFARHLE
jgi:hypothetical protein